MLLRNVPCKLGRLWFICAGKELVRIIFTERLHIVRAGDPESTTRLLVALQAHQVHVLTMRFGHTNK